MLSAGNDIVSLSEINIARTKTEPLYSKILSVSEIALYEELKSAILFEHYVWLLWSIKESAFKFLQRIDPELLFTPVKFEITQLHIPKSYFAVSFEGNESPLIISGDVEFDNYKIYSRSVIYNELISSVVDSDKDFKSVYYAIKYIDSTVNTVQSAAVRSFLIDRLVKETRTPNLTIGKNAEGTPILFEGSKELPVPVSLSHHGHYIAYSFKLKLN
jgi:phosphopantetheinyl transferase (holo-ACP synthase)